MRVGTIKMFTGPQLPTGWLYCSGASISKSTYVGLYQSIGTIYGGDGNPNFNLPNLNGRAPMCAGQSENTAMISVGEYGGVYKQTLVKDEITAHNHQLLAANFKADLLKPDVASQLAIPARIKIDDKVETNGFNSLAPDVVLQDATVGKQGGDQPHDNVQPYLGVTYIICFIGA